MTKEFYRIIYMILLILKSFNIYRRFLLTLKSYVRNRNYPEGSIAEGYMAEESLAFCSQYLQGVETKFNQSRRNCDVEVELHKHPLFPLSPVGRPIGHGEMFNLDETSWVQAHRYVLFNCDIISPYLQ